MAITRYDITKSKIYPVIVLEHWLSIKTLNRLIGFLESLFLAFIIVSLVGSMILNKLNLADVSYWNHQLWFKLLSLLCFVLGLLIIMFMFRTYLRSAYYFENIVNNQYRGKDLYTFTVGRILYSAPKENWLRGFILSATGQTILHRCGLTAEKITDFLKTCPAGQLSLTLSAERVIFLRELADALYRENEEFSRWLYSVGIGETEFLQVVDWVVKGIENDELHDRFWRRENLARIGSLGRSWSYGLTPHLDLYSLDLLEQPAAQYSPYEVSFRRAEAAKIENILSRASEANVLLIGESESMRLDTLWALAKEIKRGTILPQLEHKRVLLFDSSLFLAGFKARADFEREVIKILDEAVAAGDVILVFKDFANFIQGAASLQSQVFGLLDPYLLSSRLQVIAAVDTDKFHRILESRSEVMTRFEKVQISELTAEETIAVILSNVDDLEKQSGISFSYQALRQIVKNADAYLTNGDLVEKSKSLIAEIVPWILKQKGKIVVGIKEVDDYVSAKTNIPTGEIKETEKETLLNLDKILQKRVIGQKQAVLAVASALKRARAGVQNQSRPLGSFLFLGPTGVGKTETAKALTAAYFGEENKLMRLDMTEYQDEGSLERLIGSFSNDKPGTLTNLIRQNVFGVLLLDEFEKAHKDVMNLFLQVLDEGFFSDMNGKRVNARNLIFIATSNAGAAKIWDLLKAGQDPAEQKDEIINLVVNQGDYKPELLNRFDEIVIFRPLGPTELKQIADLMLKKLAKRLEPKGFHLVVNDYLADRVSREGANEMFGARPMNRYIQDKIEQAIADKIIAGELKAGMSVEFTQPVTGQIDQFNLVIHQGI